MQAWFFLFHLKTKQMNGGLEAPSNENNVLSNHNCIVFLFHDSDSTKMFRNVFKAWIYFYCHASNFE